MNSKVFSQRFNRELSLLGLPEDLNEKTKAVAKVFGVTRHLANAMIFGHAVLQESQLDKIAQILEVCPLWLGGQTERRKAYPGRESSDFHQESLHVHERTEDEEATTEEDA